MKKYKQISSYTVHCSYRKKKDTINFIFFEMLGRG